MGLRMTPSALPRSMLLPTDGPRFMFLAVCGGRVPVPPPGPPAGPGPPALTLEVSRDSESMSESMALYLEASEQGYMVWGVSVKKKMLPGCFC